MKPSSAGWGNGLLGVIIFSGSLPATRLAVRDFSPIFLTSARAAIAAVLGALFLFALRQQRPAKTELLPLAVVALGVVLGFPLLTALALQHITAAHSVVFVGLLPLTTALFAVLRGGERPRPAFWLFSLIGAAIVAGFALMRSGGSGSDAAAGNALMTAAIILCGLGYAEGAVLSRRLGGWQVISWALLLSLPVMAALALATVPASWQAIGTPAWLSLAYVSIFSMLVGFIFWYRGLAAGGIARVGQLQLLQPFFGLMLAALVLNEAIAPAMLLTTIAVVLCVAGAKRFS